MVTRLSNKAQEAASALTAFLDESVRKVASAKATLDGREFADENDVKAAYRGMILEIAADFHKLDPAEPHEPTKPLRCDKCVSPVGAFFSLEENAMICGRCE